MGPERVISRRTITPRRYPGTGTETGPGTGDRDSDPEGPAAPHAHARPLMSPASCQAASCRTLNTRRVNGIRNSRKTSTETSVPANRKITPSSSPR